MGPGGSQEAEFRLRASVPAGTYHVVCDAIIIGPVDVTFALIWHKGTSVVTLASWMQHWEPLASGDYVAQPYEIDVTAPAIDYHPGDQLVFRYAASNTTTPDAFIPAGGSPSEHGRIANITLPQ
ncbi:MAG TPA: hypothetical protein VFK02_31320 [Kofleriaceae bacterium]|nr:hypothetical protein [Kofleriaceae bacterium]